MREVSSRVISAWRRNKRGKSCAPFRVIWVLAFRKTVLQAVHDVDNAMVAYAGAQHRRVAAAASRDADARALTAADDQYRHGITTLLDVIAAQEGVLRGENTVVEAQADLALRLVDLYRALSGGWQSLPPG